MSRPIGMNSLFGPRSKKSSVSRKRRDRRARQFSAPESLERRAMLAFSPLAPAGDQLGSLITISTDGANSLHELTIILDDVNSPGFVTATITTTVDGAPDQTAQYFNFSGIAFSGVNDRDGSVANRVSIWTSYDANLLGREAAPSDDADVGLSTNWLVFNQFPAGISVGTTVRVDLFNADALTVTGGVLGGGDSTIAGEFESPTLPGNIDPADFDTYANIALFSGVGIANDRAGDPIVATALTLKSQTRGINLSQDVFTKYDLTMEAAQDISLGGLVEVKEGDVSLFSSSGSIAVLELVHAMAGSITIDSDCDEVEIERLCAFEDISINAPQGVVVKTELRSETGGVTITADAGPIELLDVFTLADIDIIVAQDVALRGLLQAAEGEISVTTTSGNISVSPPTSVPGSEAVIHAIEGTVSLRALRGKADVQNVIATGGITIDALGDVSLNTVIHSRDGKVSVESGGLMNNDARVVAGEDIRLTSVSHITALGGTIVRLDLLSGGANYEYAIVNIAPPASGAGRAALARATINFVANAPDGTPRGSISAIELIDPGYGYAPGEQVAVTFVGQPERSVVVILPDSTEATVVIPAGQGALGVATASESISSLTAGGSIKVQSGHSIELTTEIVTKTGDVSMSAAGGELKIADLFSARNVSLTAMETISLAGLLHSRAGNVDVVSDGGGIDVSATLLAPGGGVSLTSAGEIVQRGGSVSPNRLYLLSGGRDYTYALVVVSPPPGAGEEALARATITPFDPFDVAAGGYISSLVLLDPGWGYPSDSRVSVSIQGDGEGAAAIFGTDLVAAVIEARDDITLRGGASVTLVSAVRSAEGSVTISASLGDVAVESITAAETVSVASEQGEVFLVAVSGDGGVTVKAFQGLLVTKSVNTNDGDIVIETVNGDLAFVQEPFVDAYGLSDNSLVNQDFLVINPEAVLASGTGGSITLRSVNGGVFTPYVISAHDNVEITGFTSVVLANEITAQTGNIKATSTSGRIRLDGNLVAEQGGITLEAQTSFVQRTQSGVTKVELLASGPVFSEPPEVTVTIAPPREGGESAVAAALIERRALRRDYNDDDGGDEEDVIEYEYFIGSIVVLYPGRGYAVDEQPLVNITGVSGAVARAYGPTAVQMVTATRDILINAGENIELVTKIHSVTGDIVIRSKAGDLDLSVDSLLLSTADGSTAVVADKGSAVVQRVASFGNVTVDALQAVTIIDTLYSEVGTITVASGNATVDLRDLNAGSDVKVDSFLSSKLAGEIASQRGDIVISSISAGIFLNANLVAETGSISLAPQTFLLQQDGTGIEEVQVVDQGGVILGRNADPPEVQVTIAPPRATGGEQAQAVAILARRDVTTGDGAEDFGDSVQWYIESIRIINPGSGYALGELPITDVEGIGAAVLQAIGPTNVRQLWAEQDITIDAGFDVTLRYAATAMKGDIDVSSVSGGIDLAATTSLLHAVKGSVELTTLAAGIEANSIKTGADVTIRGETGVTVGSFIDAGGKVTVSSVIGSVSLAGEVYSLASDIDVKSVSGSVSLAANIQAEAGRVDIVAHGGLFQRVASGVQRVDLLFGGESEESVPPEVVVSIAPPRLGGLAAEAFARLRAFTNATGRVRYTLDSIEITNPGRGYEIGEQPAVTIDGVIGAAALAFGPSGFQDIVAFSDIRIEAGQTVVLTNVVRSQAGDVTVASTDGNLNLAGLGQSVHAESGSISLESLTGSVEVHRLYAMDEIGIAAERFISLGEELVARTGDITVISSSGSVFMSANVHSIQGEIAVISHHQVRQTSRSGLSRIEVLTGGRAVGGQQQPDATVIIAPPRNGGQAATAVAIVIQTGETEESVPRPIFSVQTILITNPGSGYAIGEAPQVTITGIPGALAVATGPAGMQSMIADGDLLIRAGDEVSLVDTVRSNAGNVTITSVDGTVNLSTPGQIVNAVLGSILLESQVSGVEVWRAYAGNAITINGTGPVVLENELVADTGDISVSSESGSMVVRANVHARSGRIGLAAHQQLVQLQQTGISSISIVSPGTSPSDAAPEVTVEVAPPLAGGDAATAQAIVRQTGVDADGDAVWGVVQIVITNPGSGYQVGERPLVTITGITGAIATANGPTDIQMLVAESDVSISGGDDIRLVNTVRSNRGDVTITSIDGDVNLSAPGQLVHAVAGSISLESLAGGIEYQRIIAAQDIALRSHDTLTIDSQLTTNGGDVTLASTGNNVALTANVLAADRLAIAAKTGIAQNGGFVKATDLYAENLTPAAITLDAAGNDVERFAAKNAGNVTFNDANDFRVGLRTSGTMGVEVTGSNVNLTAAGTIRAVAGIQASKLSMVADTVELVTTNATDNPTGAFSGTFRDMIALSNANTNRTSGHELVFDEPGYSVSEVNVQAALPALTRRATIDGSTATGGRLGIRGSAGVASGVRFGVGSSGSQLTTAALYGFSSGSAFVIDSSANTVSDLWFGLRADGSTPGLTQRNRVGLNVTGGGAFGNVIGSAFEFDALTANRFAGHTDAAIVLQRGANNNLVAGNLVGGDGMAANRTGIRIDGGSGNRIGTADQVSADLTPTPSNRIVGNTHYGIEVRNVRGSTTLIENNVVSGNAALGNGGHGIGVLNSAFVQIGGTSELSRNQVFSNLGGSGIHLSGSNNVRIVGNAIGTDGYHLSANTSAAGLGNGMHGVHVFGRSRDVLIDANRIVSNGGSGVAIASGSAAVNLTNNEVGAWVHPVTGIVQAAGNTADGVTITAANGNTIGAGNLIGFNRGSGVKVENSVAAGLATGNRVTGAELLGNLGHGVHLTGSSRQTVGGTGTGAGNVVRENGLDGIRIETDPRIRVTAAPQGNVVAGNFVGTNPNEEIDRGWGNRAGIAVMNGVQTVLSSNVVMNNRASGIEVSGGSSNTVGGEVATAGNFVGYNLGDGIFIHDKATTPLPVVVGVVGTTITNGGTSYSASRTTVIFSPPAAPGGLAARGVAIISNAGQVTGIQLTSKGSGYVVGEPVTVTIYDHAATVQATAMVTLGVVEAALEVTRGHVVSGNEIEANNGVGIYVKGDRTTEIQIGQDFDSRTGRGLGNKFSYHHVGVMVDAARRVSVQGNTYGDNPVPVMLMNGANRIPGAERIQVSDLKSVAWGRGQTRVTGTVVNGGAHQEYWVDVYATPYYDMDGTEGHQMRTFLGRTLVTTDATGRAAISLTVSESMGLGDHVSVKLTSNRYEDGSTVGVWHSPLAHGVDLTASPSSGSPTVTPSTSGTSGTSSGSTSTTGRGPVPVRG